ncbi:unnamed protein product [Owenia fusiformis]|uniref:COMM domain-containing protein 1 n=1 Tax=Owenia fusiformis TaxID=6347 RepID=A0A8J1U2D9_OWEFU|nr:unnamed protein product [Owenia fusiformis]
MAEGKVLLALLNGLARKEYYNEADINDDMLKEQLFPDTPDDEFAHIKQRASSIIHSMVASNMDLNQLEVFLTSQTKKKDHPLTEEQVKIYAKFWKQHRTKIHEQLVTRTVWGNTLKDVSWRVDVMSQSRSMESINTPTAIVELQLENRMKNETDSITFEMNEEKLQSVLSSLQEIDDTIKKYSS